MKGCVALLAGGLLIGAATTAAASISPIEQDPTRPGPDATTAVQIDDRTRGPAVGPTQTPDRRIESSPASTPDLQADEQLTTERGQAYAGASLVPSRPDVRAPASPTRREDGRDTSAIVPAGDDRCDPGRRPLPVACDRIIEARASEFATPDYQPLSAEQRLLAGQRDVRSVPSDPVAASRRLANGETDTSEAALAVASVALGSARDQTDDAAEDPAEPSGLDALVAGITTLVTGGPPNP